VASDVRPLAVCLKGPTAACKTALAQELVRALPLQIISVDSALVYRGMDIGTAKPAPPILAQAPHRLIDIRDPWETYSAGDFRQDALAAMRDIIAAGQIPLLVGGTMLYFHVLQAGLAPLPKADPTLRAEIDREAADKGWPALHDELCRVDPTAASRIEPADAQRIQRALEVYEISGRSLTDWHQSSPKKSPDAEIAFLKVALDVSDRKVLHERIEHRLDLMFNNGFVNEVEGLKKRVGLMRDMPSMRSVGYRQVWAHLEGEYTLDESRYRALVATRQLAKRQFTWLRSESNLYSVDALEAGRVGSISKFLATNHPILG